MMYVDTWMSEIKVARRKIRIVMLEMKANSSEVAMLGNHRRMWEVAGTGVCYTVSNEPKPRMLVRSVVAVTAADLLALKR